jgi:hypothetical protein
MAENSRCLAVAGGRWENLIPECNDLVFGFWQRAAIGCTARATSGTLCPAPREDSCVLSITTDPASPPHRGPFQYPHDVNVPIPDG